MATLIMRTRQLWWFRIAWQVALICGFVWAAFAMISRYSEGGNHKPDQMLALAAIAFATVQFVDSRLLERRTGEIIESMSTRFIGLFPDHLAHIVDITSAAKRELTVMVDFAGYGYYSRPRQYNDYLELLKRRIQDDKLQLNMIIYNEKQAFETAKRQFPRDKFEAELTSERYRSFLAYWFPTQRRHSAADYDQFIEFLIRGQERHRDDLERLGATIRRSEERLPFFVWYNDADDAVFAFQNEADFKRGFSFRTRDHRLIDGYRIAFERRWTTFLPSATS